MQPSEPSQSGLPEPPSPEVRAVQELIESCPGKTVLSSAAGFGLGGLFGMFMSSVDWQANLTEEFQKLSWKDQVKLTAKDMGNRSWSSAKNFGMVAAMFSGTECLIEQYRAKSDMWNGISAGCITGGTLAAKGGPKAMLGGCVGFAAFSAAIDYFMRHS